ncbi:MAG TPA: PepSY domain-containing protein [Candidatus Avoscillospira avicola]|uniref:PepSY domain-containing protein n=1 Tax=Candidatus Avoscillospira avicola TaxID=2840706 RepID=A0A9D1DIX1_9FIRM|nr:PepSY domain-containing protein [Candidatus Avoscillospira avicola]
MKKIKEFFNTPKKAVISCAVVAGCLLVLGTGSVFAASTIAETTSIGEAAAQNFAFADAGVDPAAAYVDRTEFDFERGQFVYEVEFIAEGTEYEYWIKASDGTVVKKESKLLSNASQAAAAAGQTGDKNGQITLEEAQAAALADAGLTAEDVTFTKGKLDYDDGVAYYDVEFVCDNTEFEYEINAATGDVYSKSKETFSTAAGNGAQNGTQNGQTTDASQSGSQSGQTAGTTQAAGTASEQIDLSAAQAAALADAGLAAEDVAFTKGELDYDDGVLTYEIEFCANGCEYSYHIDACTGAVCEKDWDDCDHARHHNGTGSGNGAGSGSAAGTGAGNAYGVSVDLEEAKSIAVAQAGLSVSDVTFLKAKLDHDDGCAVYEIEFYYDGVEHECKVSCSTGAVLEYEKDHHHD